MSHSLPQDVRWIRRRRHAGLAHGAELTRELPLWAFSAEPPRPLRILRRLCYVLSALTFASPLLFGGGYFLIEEVWTWLSLPDVVRAVSGGALLLVVASRWRTGWMLLALWLLPLLYIFVLPWTLRLLVPIWLPIFMAYYACLLETGVAGWFRREHTLTKLFGTTP